MHYKKILKGGGEVHNTFFGPREGMHILYTGRVGMMEILWGVGVYYC